MNNNFDFWGWNFSIQSTTYVISECVRYRAAVFCILNQSEVYKVTLINGFYHASLRL